MNRPCQRRAQVGPTSTTVAGPLQPLSPLVLGALQKSTRSPLASWSCSTAARVRERSARRSRSRAVASTMACTAISRRRWWPLDRPGTPPARSSL
eukprot:4162304-Lingulodinium_polyedra.AAC.2